MHVTLEDTKAWLRVDGDVEDALMERLIHVAEGLVEGILRFPLTEFEDVPEPVKQAIYIIVSQFYEKREDINMNELIDITKRLLFAYRRDAW